MGPKLLVGLSDEQWSHTMYKLYGWKLTGSLAAEAALTEAGLSFEIIPINIRMDEHHSEEYVRINSRRQVPSLALPDGTVITEGAAILLHIADATAEFRLAPEPGSPARARHDRWLLFMAVNVYEGELRKATPERYTDDPECAQPVKSAALAYVDRHYKLLNEAIGDGPYFLDNRFSVLDIYIWMLAQWMDQEWLSRECPKVKRLADTIAVRPKVAPIHAYHFG